MAVLFYFSDSDYQLTGSTAGTPLAVQSTPDGLSTTSLPPSSQQANHLPTYSHNDYNNYPTLPVSLATPHPYPHLPSIHLAKVDAHRSRLTASRKTLHTHTHTHIHWLSRTFS